MPRNSESLDRATPEVIAAEALALIEAEGPAALSFRNLGARLDVAHASLQRKVGDTEALLDLIVDHLIDQLPDIPVDTAWAEATERRFTALYGLLVDHPGLAVLRGARPLLGRKTLERLVEPQLAANLAAGMSMEQAIFAYRQMYLFTLGAANFVDHRDAKSAQQRTRSSLAALDPSEFPVLTGNLNVVVDAVVSHEVFYTGLRHLVAATDTTGGKRQD